MTIAQSLKKRASFLIIGGVSFALALGVVRYGAGEPLLQASSDLGILLGLAIIALFFVLNDIRGGSHDDRASNTGLH